MARINSIRYLGEEDVFNIEVEDTHNFITAGGTVLHNCDAVRYYCVSRVLPAEAIQAKEAFWEDEEDEGNESYDDYMRGSGTAAYLVG